ncbi:hypothetical protein AX17_002938 [Amanita inopinata Kibby_2008]|nr:hypothetical protein AX17_002938 [Amanita inopinata Kibby_2008]
MAVTLPIAIPSTPSPSCSPSSEESNPRTPVSPTICQPDQATQQQQIQPSSSPSPSQQSQQLQLNNNNAVSANTSNNNGNGQAKRKPSRRANTAERRATHNAVERQRRETLNGRFLDLAALLPNLSQIRRPSKSSIVNSSIAHIHASRRHRMHAARELRLLKLEADAMRREINEWRDRAGIPRIEEPIRSDAFSMVISGELEVLAAVPGEEEEDEMGYAGYDVDDDGYSPNHVVVAPGSGMQGAALDEMEDPRMTMLKNSNTFVHTVPSQQAHHAHHNSASNGNGLHLAHILPRPAAQGPGPMIASPTSVAFDNPAIPAMYDASPYPGGQFVQSQHQPHAIHPHATLESEKMAAWNASQMYHAQHHPNGAMMQPQRSMFTPPAPSQDMTSASPGNHSSNGSASPNPHASSSSPISPHSASSPISGAPFNDPVFFANMQRSQQQMLGHPQYGPPSERDDASSVGSSRGHRERDIQMEREQQYREKPAITPAVSSVRDRSASLSLNIAAAHGSGVPIPSPVHQGGGSPTYEIGPNGHGDYSVGVPRRGNHGGMWARDNDMTAMGGLNVGMGMGVGVGMNTVAVGGGGGSGSGFAMMM